MKRVLFYVFTLIFWGIACKTPKGNSTAEPAVTKTATITQGIVGEVTEITGNQMPMVGVPAPTPRPFKTTVYIYDSTHISKVQQIGTSPLFSSGGHLLGFCTKRRRLFCQPIWREKQYWVVQGGSWQANALSNKRKCGCRILISFILGFCLGLVSLSLWWRRRYEFGCVASAV